MTVSSAAITSAFRKTSSARRVISCRFPIGVGTTVSNGYYQPSATSVVSSMAAFSRQWGLPGARWFEGPLLKTSTGR